MNYYVKEKPCHACGRSGESIHLGKSSGGWIFMFNLNGKRFYKNVEEMRIWLRGKTIVNENGGKVSENYFWNMVEEKQRTGKYDRQYAMVIDGFNFLDCEFS